MIKTEDNQSFRMTADLFTYSYSINEDFDQWLIYDD